MKKLTEVQRNLKAGKSKFNSFGKYRYRSCEDILEAVKPLLEGVTLVISDEVVLVGDRYYIKATAVIKDVETGETESSTAYAREPEMKKGMDESQITGCASSYARKYALNGLLAIDDTRDADTMENRDAEKPIIKNDYEARVMASDLPDDIKQKTLNSLPIYTEKTLKELDEKLKLRGF